MPAVSASTDRMIEKEMVGEKEDLGTPVCVVNNVALPTTSSALPAQPYADGTKIVIRKS